MVNARPKPSSVIELLEKAETHKVPSRIIFRCGTQDRLAYATLGRSFGNLMKHRSSYPIGAGAAEMTKRMLGTTELSVEPADATLCYSFHVTGWSPKCGAEARDALAEGALRSVQLSPPCVTDGEAFFASSE